MGLFVEVRQVYLFLFLFLKMLLVLLLRCLGVVAGSLCGIGAGMMEGC